MCVYVCVAFSLLFRGYLSCVCILHIYLGLWVVLVLACFSVSVMCVIPFVFKLVLCVLSLIGFIWCCILCVCVLFVLNSVF